MGQIRMEEGELIAWKQIFPALAERVRVGKSAGGWDHRPTCEYRSKGVPVSVEYGKSPFCSCVRGKGIDKRIRDLVGGEMCGRHFVRIGLGLMFPSSGAGDMMFGKAAGTATTNTKAAQKAAELAPAIVKSKARADQHHPAAPAAPTPPVSDCVNCRNEKRRINDRRPIAVF